MPRPRAGKPVLDRAAVVRAAAVLVNTGGPDTLTIHRLARELGVKPPSLYNHIAGLADVRGELALLNARMLGDRLVAAAVGKAGAEGILALAQAYRAYIKEFPGLYQASLLAAGNRPSPPPGLAEAEERVVRTVLALLEPFGLQGDDAIHAARALRAVVHGFATLEVAGGFGIPLDLDESFNRLVREVMKAIRPAPV